MGLRFIAAHSDCCLAVLRARSLFHFLPSTKRWKTKCPNCGGRYFLQTRTIGLDSLSMHHILFLRHLNQYISCITQAIWRHTCCIVLAPLADALWVPRAQSHFSEGTFTIWGVNTFASASNELCAKANLQVFGWRRARLPARFWPASTLCFKISNGSLLCT